MNCRTASRSVARLGVFASTLLLSIGLASPASSDSRVWSVTSTAGSVTATDCTDCGDDIGILIDCDHAGKRAKAQVLWASRQRGNHGKVLPIRLNIGGQKFVYEASTILLGQVGYVPEFNLTLDDPLIEALSAGSVAHVRFSGGRSKLALKGSRNALTSFVQQCVSLQRTVAAGAAPESVEDAHATGPIALSEILGMMTTEPGTRSEIEQQVESGGLSSADIMCSGSRLGRHWAHIGGQRIAPFKCELSDRRLTIEADTDFLLRDDKALASNDLFKDTNKVVHSNFRWKID